jgi:hypothetical protein
MRSAICRVTSSSSGFLAMADFQKLDPETRAFALVGQFLQAWSTMENSLHDAIGAALSIEAPKLQILCANMRLRDKIDILRTLIDIAPGFATEEKTKLKKSLHDIAEYSVNRNMLAHDSFRPESAGAGVEFLTVKAKGKFELPNVVWSADRFQQEGKTVDQYRSLLDGLRARFQTRPLGPESFALGRPPWMSTMQSQGIPLALLHSLYHQPATDIDSGPANQEKGAQTPEEPERKE